MSNRKQYEENLQSVKPAMFLATSYDKESEAWTGQSPTAAVSISGNSILFAISVSYAVQFICYWDSWFIVWLLLNLQKMFSMFTGFMRNLRNRNIFTVFF